MRGDDPRPVPPPRAGDCRGGRPRVRTLRLLVDVLRVTDVRGLVPTPGHLPPDLSRAAAAAPGRQAAATAARSPRHQPGRAGRRRRVLWPRRHLRLKNSGVSAAMLANNCDRISDTGAELVWPDSVPDPSAVAIRRGGVTAPATAGNPLPPKEMRHDLGYHTPSAGCAGDADHGPFAAGRGAPAAADRSSAPTRSRSPPAASWPSPQLRANLRHATHTIRTSACGWSASWPLGAAAGGRRGGQGGVRRAGAAGAVRGGGHRGAPPCTGRGTGPRPAGLITELTRPKRRGWSR